MHHFLDDAEQFDPEAAIAASYRIEVRGPDQWSPEHVFLWGDATSVPATPLAMAIDLDVRVSTDVREGHQSFPLHRVFRGAAPEVRRLLLLVATRDEDDAETENEITVKIVSKMGEPLVDYALPDSPQGNREQGVWEMHLTHPIRPFKKVDLDDSSITVRTNGDDSWAPRSFWLFGLDTVEGLPSYIVPLIDLEFWSNKWPGNLSTDPSEGHEEVTLPLAP